MRKEYSGILPKFAWPGGYQMQYFTKDGLVVCPDCANREIDQAQEVIAGEPYWEGPTIQCDDCQCTIESAYGDPNDESI